MTKQTLDNVYVKPSPQNSAYFIDDDIGDPSNYRELTQLLISMSEDDTLELHINSFGGYLHTTTMLSALIRNCRGQVHGVLSGVAMSGGSILLLSCHSVEVMPHSTFMAHTSSAGGGYGKLSDTVRSTMSSVKQLEALYKDVYYGFYTEEEINDILDGKDSYLEYDEICQRLENRDKLRHAEAKSQMEQNQKQLDDMFAIPDESLLGKLTKAQLIQYIKGEIDIDKSETGGVLIIPLPTEE